MLAWPSIVKQSLEHLARAGGPGGRASPARPADAAVNYPH